LISLMKMFKVEVEAKVEAFSLSPNSFF